MQRLLPFCECKDTARFWIVQVFCKKNAKKSHFFDDGGERHVNYGAQGAMRGLDLHDLLKINCKMVG